MAKEAEPTPPPRPLPEGYYADNFELVLRTAAERYEDLLRPEEDDFYRSYTDLPTPARRLYVRLISRRGPSFRRDRLAYREIPDLDTAVAELTAAGLADGAEDADLGELLALLLRPELAELARERLPEPPPTATRRDQLLAALAELPEPGAVAAELRRRLGVVRPLRLDEVRVFRLLFFGNLRQDWTELVLRDLGVVRYEPYELRRELRLFPDRQALDHTLVLRRYRQLVGELLAVGDVVTAVELAGEVLERADRWHPQARRLADRVLRRAGRALERAGDFEAALPFYRAAHRPPARERQARVLARLGRCREALELCREIAAEPRDETEPAFARRFTHHLRRQLGEKLAPRRRKRRPKEKMTIPKRGGASAEELALEALAAGGHRGFFSENWLWKSLFGLAFWDVVFAPVAGAFQHPFQYGPLDLGTPDFRRARAEAVEARLEELRADPDPGPRLLELYDQKRDTANALVAWDPGLRPCLELALRHLQGHHLATVCDRLSRDPGRYRRGLPDLFVLPPTSTDRVEPAFHLYEVKAPGDQLRPEQGAWIDYLNENGLPASILELRWG